MKLPIKENVNLTNYNTYKINTTCKYLVEPSNNDELVACLNWLKDNNIPYHVIGGGSNIILPDEEFDGAILKLNIKDYYVDESLVFGGAGLSLNEFINHTLDNGFVSLTNLYGIPGTLGGAIYGNAGAMGVDIFTCLESILVYIDDDVTLVKKNDIKYGYRNTEFKENNWLILGALFKLEKGDVSKAREVIRRNLESRRDKQPLEYPNAGSVFKNPQGESAGKLIEDCNLKGVSVNDAEVSSKHANFIINKGHAKSEDIIKLIENVRKEVKVKTNIDLELEQIIMKW